MIIDVHCHYTFSRLPAIAQDRFSFEPSAEGDDAVYDSYISPRAERRWAWGVFRRILGLPNLPAGPELDEELRRLHDRHLLSEGPVERIVLLAFDAYHDDAGKRPLMPARASDVGTDIYTSNSLVREACRRRPERFLFGASVHPYRDDAVACVREVFAAGACLLKWLPLHQNIDIADARTLAVLRCCAVLGLPVLAHYGGELTLKTQHPEFQSVTSLLDVLRRLRREGAMPPVIVAHLATPVTPFGDVASHQRLIDALLGEFRDAPLYADTSALTTLGKVGFLRQAARMQELHGKLLFGSDYPVPIGLARLRRDLGNDWRRVAADPSWIQQAALIHRRLGLNEIVLHRASELLPHVDRVTPG